VEERTHELIAARDLAEQASRAKGDFLSSMSHELRTPMNAILGFSQLLQLDRNLDARSAGYVHEILRAGHHLLTLINEVLDLARIESGRLSLSPEPLPLAELVRETHALVQPLAQQREVALSVAPLQGLVVRADRLRLKQVLLNLLSNAVKYNRAGGTVQVEAQAQDMFTVRIRVRDSGIGIAAHSLPQLFQPFSRVSGSTAEGTGIGLSISQRLVAMMGGRIGVHSTPGVGSEFWVELPSDQLADPPPPLLTPGVAATPPRPGRRGRVLYVEDNPANLKLVEQIVARHVGVELLMAPSGSLGLDLARSHQPDLLLLDIHLPDIDGFQVLARLRADEATRRMPVVAVTAQAMPDDVKRVLAAGFDGYIAKPLDLARFDELLQRMLDASEPEAPPPPA
jgi:CheY-like chemotaxis protein